MSSIFPLRQQKVLLLLRGKGVLVARVRSELHDARLFYTETYTLCFSLEVFNEQSNTIDQH